MEFVGNNLQYIFAAVVLVVLLVGLLWGFVKLPRERKVAQVKHWLLSAVLEAERALGAGTGPQKLRRVYDLFVERFPRLARMVSFETFAKWVDEALETMRDLVEQIAAEAEEV